MSLGRRVNEVLARLALCPQGSAIDYGADLVTQGKGGHGKHGATSQAPPRVHSLAVEWAEFFRRATDLAELDLAMERGEQERPEPVRQGRVGSRVAATRKARILRSPLYQGRPDSFVAYVEGCSTDLVRKTRGERGLDAYGLKPDTARPLTTTNPED